MGMSEKFFLCWMNLLDIPIFFVNFGLFFADSLHMKKILITFTLFFTFFSISAKEIKPLYKLEDDRIIKTDKTIEGKTYLVGSDQGLFRINPNNTATPIWDEGAVEQIVRTELPAENDKVSEIWYFRTAKGILYSEDLTNFELRNEGLPFLTIKKYDGVNTEFEKVVHQLKDLCINPKNPLQIVTATKDNVYLSRDGGKTWKSIGSMSKSTSGIKAVAIGDMPVFDKQGELTGTELVVFMSHPIFGLSYMKVDAANPKWNDVTAGFEMMKTMASTDEISDILPVLTQTSDGKMYSEMYLSQTYLPRLYKFNWPKRCGELIYKNDTPVETFDALSLINTNLIYTKNEGIGAINITDYQSPGTPEKLEEWKAVFDKVPGNVNAAYIPHHKSGFKQGVTLGELWLLYPGTINTPYGEVAKGRKCVYASAYQCRLQSGIDKFKKIVLDNKCNGIVIDMKDDYGLLRYDTKDPFLQEKGKVTQYAVNLDHFVEEFKKDDIYLVARIVVFKDRNLSKYGNSKYAVWNSQTKAPWLGIREFKDKKDETTGEVIEHVPEYYDENWVDPYCPEVWEYNVAIAKELISRGFDEIQFDYIRFPTDGLNLGKATYRWKSEGMDKESALNSFLLYARQNIQAPIGIDIYGANGWYRSGTRTGQDVEMLAQYVDVIGPMFYPSHFEQKFLNYEPWSERTYRIYYYGTYRNTVMARNRSIVRPWVQAFYLNVSYDRTYYNKDYVIKQVYGARDSVDNGYMYWNNSGDYSYISPDPESNPYDGPATEARPEVKKPALGTEKSADKTKNVSLLREFGKDFKKMWVTEIKKPEEKTYAAEEQVRTAEAEQKKIEPVAKKSDEPRKVASFSRRNNML